MPIKQESAGEHGIQKAGDGPFSGPERHGMATDLGDEGCPRQLVAILLRERIRIPGRHQSTRVSPAIQNVV